MFIRFLIFLSYCQVETIHISEICFFQVSGCKVLHKGVQFRNRVQALGLLSLGWNVCFFCVLIILSSRNNTYFRIIEKTRFFLTQRLNKPAAAVCNNFWNECLGGCGCYFFELRPAARRSAPERALGTRLSTLVVAQMCLGVVTCRNKSVAVVVALSRQTHIFHIYMIQPWSPPPPMPPPPCGWWVGGWRCPIWWESK